MAKVGIRVLSYIILDSFPISFIVTNAFALTTDWQNSMQCLDYVESPFKFCYQFFIFEFCSFPFSNLF